LVERARNLQTRRERGFALIAALFLLVVLAALDAATGVVYTFDEVTATSGAYGTPE
jgi:Tfp pilus assembly protein PilX